MSGAELVAFVNRMNAEWVAVARRLSPRVIVDLLEVTGPWVVDLFRATDPFAAGALGRELGRARTTSPIGSTSAATTPSAGCTSSRFATRSARRPLTGRVWLHPVLDLFVRALPFAYRETPAEAGATVGVTIEGEAGGDWSLRREEGRWRLYRGRAPDAAATVTMTDDTAWRLFSKGLKRDAARARVTIGGDQALGAVAVGALAVLA